MQRRYRMAAAVLAVGLLAACGPGGTGPSATGTSTSPRGGTPPDPSAVNPDNVAVLVVDDFGLGQQSDPTPWSKTDNCALATNEVGSGGAGDDPPPPPYSHGEIVYRTLRQQLATPANHLTAGAVETTHAGSHVVEVASDWAYHRGGRSFTVRLQAVHTAGYKTADIINGLTDAVAKLSRAQVGGVRYTRFVVNLSFVVIPCDVGAWLNHGDADLLASYQSLIVDDSLRKALAAKGYLDLATNTYQRAVIAPNGLPVSQAVLTNPDLQGLRWATVSTFYNAIGDNLRGDLARQVSSDPSWQRFRAKPAGDSGAAEVTVVPVGAAGNGVWYRPSPTGPPVRKVLHFPFAPALWESVVSVSAANDGTLADYSNWGEVSQAGNGPDIAPSVRGTSFAAPRVSGQESMYLLRGGPVACDHSTPPLKYVPDPGTGGWANLNWPSWDGKCHNFMSYATDS
jgi:hypothetical protein